MESVVGSSAVGCQLPRAQGRPRRVTNSHFLTSGTISMPFISVLAFISPTMWNSGSVSQASLMAQGPVPRVAQNRSPCWCPFSDTSSDFTGICVLAAPDKETGRHVTRDTGQGRGLGFSCCSSSGPSPAPHPDFPHLHG